MTARHFEDLFDLRTVDCTVDSPHIGGPQIGQVLKVKWDFAATDALEHLLHAVLI
jgi:hypothetical protein